MSSARQGEAKDTKLARTKKRGVSRMPTIDLNDVEKERNTR
ncbi:hypothetical protein ACEVJK_01970 [Flintibacter sp. P01028]|nr:hypothetical protein [Flintibacter hominis]